MNLDNFKLTCSPENAAKFAEWIKSRGGVAKWQSADLSNPNASWSTPARTLENQPTPQPYWKAESQPVFVVTDPAEIGVVIDREVKRVHFSLKRGDSFNLVLTDASSLRVYKAVFEAGNGAYHVFDGDEAVIMTPESVMSLAEWISSQTIEPNKQNHI